MKNSNTFEPSHYPMQEIPAGIIALRDDRTKQNWSVEIQPFLMGKFAVTQAVFSSVTNKSPAQFKGNQNPVETVSWHDAIAFCNLASEKSGFTPCYAISMDREDVSIRRDGNGYRLPSEAEWEYACRAGSSGARYGNLNDTAWYKDNSDDKSHPVAQKQPNNWGLHDMLGNVWEWCWDKYDPEVYGSYRVFRGGGWADPERGILITNRRRSHPTFKIDDLGFRIARSLPKKV